MPRGSLAIFCRSCLYPLGGLRDQVCPECGRAFDRNDPATVFQYRMPLRLDRWLCATLTWPELLLMAVATWLSLLDSFDIPWPTHRLTVLGFLLWLALIGWWALRLAVRMALLSYYGPAAGPLRGRWGRWWIPPIAFAATMLIMFLVDV